MNLNIKATKKEPKNVIEQPFSLYTYYLMAVIGTFVIPLIIVVILEESFGIKDLNDYVFITLFPTTFIGILLIGYFKWWRFRKLIGKKIYKEGLLSMPAGLPARIAIESIESIDRAAENANKPFYRKEIPAYIATIIILLAITAGNLAFKINEFIYNNKASSNYTSSNRKGYQKEIQVKNWQTYRNERYGFEVKYPENFKHKSLNKNDELWIDLAPEENLKSGQVEKISIVLKEKALDLKNIIGLVGERINKEDLIKQVIDGRPAYSYKGRYGDCLANIFFISNNDKTIEISFVDCDRGGIIQISDYINQVISTFKFIYSTDISNWPTYQNEKYKYEVQYPSDWVIYKNQLKNEVNFYKNNVPMLFIGIKQGKNLYDWTDNFRSEVELYKKTTFKGLAAVRIVFKDSPHSPSSEEYFFIYNNNLFALNFSTASKSEMNQIISTFKFINSDETGGWKIYSDDKYKFTLKYPPEWRVEKNIGNFFEEGGYAYVIFFHKEVLGRLPYLSIKDDWSIEKEINSINTIDPPFTKVLSTSKDIIGLYEVTRIKYQSTIGVSFEKIVIIKDKNAFVFAPGTNSTEELDKFYKVISSLEFNL